MKLDGRFDDQIALDSVHLSVSDVWRLYLPDAPHGIGNEVVIDI